MFAGGSSSHTTFIFHVASCWHFSDLCNETKLLQYNVDNKIVTQQH